MMVYVDSSVLLRVVFGEAQRLGRWPSIGQPVSSALIRLECLRTIDRARLVHRLPDVEVATLRGAVFAQLAGFRLVPVDESILEQAAQPFPTALASLDAIHLATALGMRRQAPHLRIATHDAELAVAAKANGFEVLGI